MAQVVKVRVPMGRRKENFVLNNEATVEWNGDTYLYQPMTCLEQLQACCCPCAPWFDLAAPGGKTLRYRNSCICCCCSDEMSSWKAYSDARTRPPCICGESDGKMVGRSSSIGCCENGAFFALCPCLSCTGQVATSKYRDAQNNEMYSVRRNLDCCTICNVLCIPLGIFSMLFWDCIAWCDGENYAIFSEDIYPPKAEGILEGVDDKPVGKVVSVQRIYCIGCCAVRVPRRYSVVMPGALQRLPAMGIIPFIYNGMPTPFGMCCRGGGERQLTGVSCVDRGRSHTFKRATFKQMLDATNDEGSAINQVFQFKMPVQANVGQQRMI